MQRRTVIRALAAWGGSGLTACHWFQPPAAPAGWLSLSPPLTETAFAIGATLVGRSTFCTLPPEALALPSAGTALTPKLEAIAALAPLGILVDGSLAVDVDRLKAVAPVEVLPWLTLAEVIASTGRLGEVLGRADAARALSDRFTSAFAGTPAADAPRVLLALAGADLGRGSLWYLQADSLHGAALAAAGFRNAVPDPITGPPQMSLERLIELDPDHIVVLAGSALDAEAQSRTLEAFRAITPLSAVRNGRIGVLQGAGTLSTGPSILELPDRLSAVLRASVRPPQ